MTKNKKKSVLNELTFKLAKTGHKIAKDYLRNGDLDAKSKKYVKDSLDFFAAMLALEAGASIYEGEVTTARLVYINMDSQTRH